jgi:hypothetical protein
MPHLPHISYSETSRKKRGGRHSTAHLDNTYPLGAYLKTSEVSAKSRFVKILELWRG